MITGPFTVVRDPSHTVRNYCRFVDTAGNISTPSFPCSETEFYTGYKNSDYVGQIARGENASTDFTGYKGLWTVKRPGYFFAILTNPDINTIGWSPSVSASGIFMSGTAAWSAVDTSYVEGKVVKQLLSHMRADFRALTTLGEMRETLKMLRSPFRSLTKQLDGYANRMKPIRDSYRKRRDLTRWRKTAADSWLEFSFGLRPLCSDITELANAYNRHFEPSVHISRARVTKKLKLPPSYAEVGTGGVTAKTTKLTTHISRCSIVCAVRTQPQQQKRKDLGLTTLDLLPTIWELVPWSFLVDYVVDVGGMLDDFVTWAGADIAWASQTIVSECLEELTSTYVPTHSTWYTTTANVPGVATHSSKRVLRNSNYVVPPTFAPSVVLAERFSFTRGLNVAALLNKFL